MKRRILSTLLALCTVLALLPGTAWAANVASGKCGANATWTLDSSGILTISGTGPMQDYEPLNSHDTNAPWFAYYNDITRIVVKNGITRIGSFAFANCKATSVSIGNTVDTIRFYAFLSCPLSTIAIPVSVKSIEEEALGTFPFHESISYAGTEAQWNKINIDENSGVYNNPDGRIIYMGSPGTDTIVSGNCGTNIIWSINNNGTLVISGTGEIPQHEAWNTYWERIERISIGNGITGIGQDTFNWLTQLYEISVPTSVKEIKSPFYQCNLGTVIYAGTKVQWGKIKINPDANARFNSNSCKLIFEGDYSQTHVVTFDPNGGTCSIASKQYKANAPLGTLPVPTRSGCRFIGWYTSQNGGSEVTATTKVTADMTVYARWSWIITFNYTVAFNANGGNVSPEEKEYTANAPLGTLPTPTRTGYKFNGWYTKETGGTKVTASTKVTADMTLYAHWTKNPTTKTYTIKLNANGGKVSPASIKVESGKTYFDGLPTPTRAGYQFDGWYTTRTGSTKITASTKATANRTIYAHWTRISGSRTHMVTFDANGGTVYQDRKIVFSGIPYRDLPTPTKNNSHFQGWYTQKTGGKKVTAASRVDLTEDQTLYARWQSSATVRSTQRGTYRVTIPAYYDLALYASGNSARIASQVETTTYQTVTCTQKATLSNGTVRYYGKVGGKTGWFTYSCEMDVK